jgi:NAD-dependent SIR2 family protein deacetylase
MERVSAATVPITDPARDLAAFVRAHPRLLVLTGAGCSVASGIPEYRDHEGAWKSRPPVRFAEFVSSAAARRRYWGRSMVGWERVAAARPARVHHALASLERGGHVEALVTQNVDALHQRAGSRRVVDLHGRLDRVECLECGGRLDRADVQALLRAWNRGFAGPLGAAAAGPARPDGDAQVEADFSSFRVPDCPSCGGILKPGVVFFGENVPRTRVEAALGALAKADALLVVGSSLMVFSGYRFCLAARAMGKPVAAVNLGRTRADDLLAMKVVSDCGSALAALADALACPRDSSPRPPVPGL